MKRLPLPLGLGALALLVTACPPPAPQPPPERRPVTRRPPPDRPATRRTPPPRRVVKRPPPLRPVVAWRARPPKPGPTPPIVTPKVETHRLKNGLQVLLVRRPNLPLVNLRLVLRVGSYEDPPGKPGVASLTADLLNDGVKGLTALQLAERAGGFGASLSSWAGEDGTQVAIRVLRRHFGKALGLLSRAVRQPTFDPKELARRQKQTVNYVRRVLNHPSAIASLVFARVIHGATHPYGRLDSGRPKQIGQITRGDILAFYKQHYRPGRAALVIVGDVTWRQVRAQVRRRFGAWRGAPTQPAPVKPAAPPKGRLFVTPLPRAPQTEIRVGHAGPARKHPDRVALMVMNTILGGSFTSRINLNLRERHGWTYGAYSRFTFPRRPGAFRIQTAVQASATVPAVREILAEVRRMAGGRITPGELRLARQSLSVSVSGWFVTNRGVAGAVARLFLHSLPRDFYQRFPVQVQAVDAAAVARVAKAHLKPGQLRVVLVGDPRFMKGLGRLGLGKPRRMAP